jgi:hypothetical protein
MPYFSEVSSLSASLLVARDGTAARCAGIVITRQMSGDSGVVHLVAGKLTDRTGDLDRLSEDDVRLPPGRLEDIAHPRPNPTARCTIIPATCACLRNCGTSTDVASAAVSTSAATSCGRTASSRPGKSAISGFWQIIPFLPRASPLQPLPSSKGYALRGREGR